MDDPTKDIDDPKRDIGDPKEDIDGPSSAISDPKSAIADPKAPLKTPRRTLVTLKGTWVTPKWQWGSNGVLTVPRAITPLSPHRVSCPPGPPANTIVPSGSHPKATTAPGTALLGGVGDIAMGSPEGGRDPKWAQIEAKRPQNGPQMDTKWPQMDPKWTQNGHK